MLFNYSAISENGKETSGSIDAISLDVAIGSLQRRGLVISSIVPADGSGSFWKKNISLFSHVPGKDVVILSRQLATLFEAQVSALRIFRLLAEESPNRILRSKLAEIADDLQGGTSISNALGKHPDIFSGFYVNMVRSGEEVGKLDETFNYLADYLDRTYEITSKARNALIYPAFVVTTFMVVMILMLTLVIPRITSILLESGQEIPFYTRVVMAISNFFINYGVFFVVLLAVGGFFLWKFSRTSRGAVTLDEVKLSVPFLGDLYRKLYLSRVADNLSTMLTSGISVIRAVEITATVVASPVYEAHLAQAVEAIRGGSNVSEAFERSGKFPGIMVQMIRVGEETGEVGSILKTLARFYHREVTNAVDTLVNLIEPIMIVALGLGVGVLLASVLIPIYSVSSSI